jgi:hypothetical protein
MVGIPTRIVVLSCRIIVYESAQSVSYSVAKILVMHVSKFRIGKPGAGTNQLPAEASYQYYCVFTTSVLMVELYAQKGCTMLIDGNPCCYIVCQCDADQHEVVKQRSITVHLDQSIGM